MNRNKICKSTGKRQFATQREAEFEAKLLNGLHIKKGLLGVYKCPNCKTFHHRNELKRRARRR